MSRPVHFKATLNKLLLSVGTVHFLRPIQISYRLFYIFRKRWHAATGFQYNFSINSNARPLRLETSISSSRSWFGENCFTFLHLTHDFGEAIDWNFIGYGKLWIYNLTYFDYLNQPEFEQNVGLKLIWDFIEQAERVKDGMEPFPISLRGMNWIKFLSRHNIKEPSIDNSLYAQYQILVDNLEYHLLGNHLLENGFSLLFGAYYFRDIEFLKSAEKILEAELEEQILPDGAHFELSPMYHQIMLFRVLDCINLLTNNSITESKESSSLSGNHDLISLLRTKAAIMMGWLKQVSFADGSIPLFNDSVPGIAPITLDLMEYADKLGIEANIKPLKESGYRKFKGDRYELMIDVGPIGPDYIPGHGHCDMLSFILYVDGKPCIVDTGCSTYEANECRQFERSTEAHNTVAIEGTEQSEVWAAFRVARRANIISLHEGTGCVEAAHNGFKKRGVIHSRRFECYKDRIVITDHLSREYRASTFLHYDHAVDLSKIEILSAVSPEEGFYEQALGFNVRTKAELQKIQFRNQNRLEIRIK